MIGNKENVFHFRSPAGNVRRPRAWGLIQAMFSARCSGRADNRFARDADVPALLGCLDSLVDQGQTIKPSDNIDVCRANWRNHDTVVKQYKHVSLFHSIRHTLKGSRARRAWANGHRLLELGVHTPVPRAYIDEYRGLLLWQSYLITEYVEGKNLRDLLAAPQIPDGRKRRIVHQILRQIDRLGSHGVTHGDMKHTNILWDGARVVLTDLDGMETHRLGCLHRQRRVKDIARFLRNMSFPEMAADAPHAKDLCRAERGNHDFIRIAADGGTFYVNQAYRSKTLEDALQGGQHVLREAFQAEPVRSARSSDVCRFGIAFHGIEKHVYAKTYLDRSLADRLKHYIRPSRALRAMRGSLLLLRHGLQAPEIVAAGWNRSKSGRRQSFLATLDVAGGKSLYDHLVPRPGCPPLCTSRERRELLRTLGHAVGRMHAAGIYHGDLRPGNVLVRPMESKWGFFFIDNERTRKLPYLPARLRLKNLVQINMLPRTVSGSERMRFFQSYILANPSVCAAYKAWARRIMARTRRRFDRKGWQ